MTSQPAQLEDLQAISAEYQSRMNLAASKGSGQFYWWIGNVPASADNLALDIALQYGKPYQVTSWIFPSSSDGTRFASDRTGHGMFVSVENAYAF